MADGLEVEPIVEAEVTPATPEAVASSVDTTLEAAERIADKIAEKSAATDETISRLVTLGTALGALIDDFRAFMVRTDDALGRLLDSADTLEAGQSVLEDMETAEQEGTVVETPPAAPEPAPDAEPEPKPEQRTRKRRLI